ncbi:hypothetical protein [Halobacillus halophilus]|uniref:hypothetical protein n=1 Tax=Halobacillus halophilus TaxID=1570 RepID=UPI001CD493AB|nr:hypothetical protein [Halobacillus halophilus]MCA1011593.1 hypothetical protein [Halobacillus halophilus]
MKHILGYFIFMTVILHGVLDIFDGVSWLFRFINMGFLLLIAVIIYSLSNTTINNRRVKQN